MSSDRGRRSVDVSADVYACGHTHRFSVQQNDHTDLAFLSCSVFLIPEPRVLGPKTEHDFKFADLVYAAGNSARNQNSLTLPTTRISKRRVIRPPVSKLYTTSPQGVATAHGEVPVYEWSCVTKFMDVPQEGLWEHSRLRDGQLHPCARTEQKSSSSCSILSRCEQEPPRNGRFGGTSYYYY